jgi:excisionase family DNA binding protein
MEQRGLLTTGAIAKKLNVHRSTVWKWISSGMLQSEQVTPRFVGVSEASLKLFQSRFIPDSLSKESPTKKAPRKAATKAPKSTKKSTKK